MSKRARDYLELARRAAAPQLSPTRRRARFGDTRDHPIEAGQIWRASWDEVSMLVVVRDIDHTELKVIPLTIDPPAEDSDCVVLEAKLTAFDTEVSLWAGLASTLPLRVLDEIIDQLPNETSEWLFTADLAKPPRGVRRGRAPTNPFEPSIEIRAMIDDDLTTLRSSPALPVATDEDSRPVPSLASLLGKNVDLAALVAALSPLGLDQPAVMSLLRGKRPVSPEIADAVATVTCIEPAQVAAAVQPLPARFVEEVDHPRWRQVWRERAERTGSREEEARLAASYEMFARAARQTGAPEPDWHARLAQFRVVEGPLGAS
ncbi:hypothetical protein [Mycolicibacterium helvum]|nr:hypothetical protein [Mycolicibacterium helvum]